MSPSSGTQTLDRSLALLEAAAEIHDLDQLAEEVGLTRSTAYRLLTALVQWGYLRHIRREGYFLGPKLIELGFKHYEDLHLPSIARPNLERLTELTNETTHLAVLEIDHLTYIDKVLGTRNLQMTSRIGARAEVQCTALGKALISGLPSSEWPSHFNPDFKKTPNSISTLDGFLTEIRKTKERGYSLDLEENEIGVRCIAAPLFGGDGEVIGAISISGASVYLDEERIKELIPLVKKTAANISKEMGWNSWRDGLETEL
jgi:DNA-binding IclR family transcriptional regulator